VGSPARAEFSFPGWEFLFPSGFLFLKEKGAFGPTTYSLPCLFLWERKRPGVAKKKPRLNSFFPKKNGLEGCRSNPG